MGLNSRKEKNKNSAIQIYSKSPFELITTRIWIQKQKESLRIRLKTLKESEETNNEVLANASDMLIENIQPLIVEIRQLDLEIDKAIPESEKRMNEEEKNENEVINSFRNLQQPDLKNLFRYTISNLHHEGYFPNTHLFQNALNAYKKGEFDKLFECYEASKDEDEHSTKNSMYAAYPFSKEDQEAITETIQQELCLLHYLQLSCDVLKERIEKQQDRPIYKAYQTGPDAFQSFIQNARRVKRNEIIALKNKLAMTAQGIKQEQENGEEILA